MKRLPCEPVRVCCRDGFTVYVTDGDHFTFRGNFDLNRMTSHRIIVNPRIGSDEYRQKSRLRKPIEYLCVINFERGLGGGRWDTAVYQMRTHLRIRRYGLLNGHSVI